ncbi:2365_t:CDS:2 [Entrophospora sp. SA101]|nr:3947_t:CDS:2 [Entrophospora sp. SA101]CAJ0757623.1 2365_t:CDS:2 [Entrophospora sp. SA101]
MEMELGSSFGSTYQQNPSNDWQCLNNFLNCLQTSQGQKVYLGPEGKKTSGGGNKENSGNSGFKQSGGYHDGKDWFNIHEDFHPQLENYKFLPTPDKFVKIKEQFINEVWGTLEKQNYYLLRSKNNTFTIILQNRGQYDFADPRIVLFFGRNTNDSESKRKNEKAGRKGQDEHICPACNNCYDFCGDLRNKRAVPVGYLKPSYPKWQPKVKLLFSYTPTTTSGSEPSAVVITDDECKKCKNENPNCEHEYTPVLAVPSNIHLQKYVDNQNFLEGLLKDCTKPLLIFLVDGGDSSDPVGHKGKDNSTQNIVETPHLLNHSSAQFYFQKKLLFTANLKHLYVRRKNPGWVLELKVRGSVINESFISQLTSSVLLGFVKKGGKMLANGIASFVPGGTLFKKGFKAITSLFGGKKDDKKEGDGGGDLKNILTKEKYEKMLTNPFYIRFEHSEALYNNLANNNNTSPIQNIQNRFSAFKQYTFNSGTVPGQEDVDIIPGESKKDEATSHDNITKHDNRVLFIERPYCKNSDGDNVLEHILPQTPNFTGGEGIHEAKSNVVLTLEMKEGGGKGKGDGVVYFSLESGSEDQIIHRFKFDRQQAEREKDYEAKEYDEPE